MPEQPSTRPLKPMPRLTKDDLSVRYGTTGTQYYTGYFSEEYSADWRDQQRVLIVEEMRRGDGVISALLSALKTPLKASNWYIQAASEEAQDKAIAEEVEYQLFHMPNRGFMEFFRELLSYLDFGHYAFEKIWYIRGDGKIALRDLAPRVPSSILRWETEDNLPGITQYIRSDQNYEKDRKENQTLSIPINKLLIFTNQKEGDDLTGISILRAAYKHWYYVNSLYRLQAIAIERLGAGIPEAIFDQVGQQEKDAMEAAMKNLYQNEQGYIMHGKNIEFKLATPDGSGMRDAMDTAIKHHNRMMLMSVLAEWMDLGSGSSGSYALSQDQSSFFLQHLEDVGKYISEQINRYVVREIVDLNFPGTKWYPELKFTPLGNIDYKEMSEVVEKLVNAGVLDKDPELAQFIRKMFRFPLLSDEQMAEMDIAKVESELNAIEKQFLTA